VLQQQQQQHAQLQYGPVDRKDQQNDRPDYAQSAVNTDQPSAQAHTALHAPFATAGHSNNKQQSSQKV